VPPNLAECVPKFLVLPLFSALFFTYFSIASAMTLLRRIANPPFFLPAFSRPIPRASFLFPEGPLIGVTFIPLFSFWIVFFPPSPILFFSFALSRYEDKICYLSRPRVRRRSQACVRRGAYFSSLLIFFPDYNKEVDPLGFCDALNSFLGIGCAGFSRQHRISLPVPLLRDFFFRSSIWARSYLLLSILGFFSFSPHASLTYLFH